MINRDEFLKMAREAGFHYYDMREIGAGESVEADSLDALERLKDAILERAAVEAESNYFGNDGELNHEIAEAIRALKTQGN